MSDQTHTTASRRSIRALHRELLDVVDLASAGSFPASDAPPWTSGPPQPTRESDESPSERLYDGGT